MNVSKNYLVWAWIFCNGSVQTDSWFSSVWFKFQNLETVWVWHSWTKPNRCRLLTLASLIKNVQRYHSPNQQDEEERNMSTPMTWIRQSSPMNSYDLNWKIFVDDSNHCLWIFEEFQATKALFYKHLMDSAFSVILTL